MVAFAVHGGQRWALWRSHARMPNENGPSYGADFLLMGVPAGF